MERIDSVFRWLFILRIEKGQTSSAERQPLHPLSCYTIFPLSNISLASPPSSVILYPPPLSRSYAQCTFERERERWKRSSREWKEKNDSLRHPLPALISPLASPFRSSLSSCAHFPLPNVSNHLKKRKRKSRDRNPREEKKMEKVRNEKVRMKRGRKLGRSEIKNCSFRHKYNNFAFTPVCFSISLWTTLLQS